MNIILLIVISVFLFLLFDNLWFKFSYEHIYQPMFKEINNEDYKLQILPGLYAWILLGLSIILFVLPLSKSLSYSFYYGCLIGLIIYGVYNGTNKATIKNYSDKVFIYDNIWGVFVSGLVSSIVFYIQQN
jgi:uncharacterized membrane protein